jgi:hypothetical protein
MIVSILWLSLNYLGVCRITYIGKVLGEVPAAFIVPEPEVELDMTKLLKTCRVVLPDYKVPVSFYSIEAIPVTASGKPKRIAALDLLNTGTACRMLAAPLMNRENIGPFVLAECIAVCSSDIGLENIDPEESFMSLGLNSMKSVVLRDRLSSLTGLDLPITCESHFHREETKENC